MEIGLREIKTVYPIGNHHLILEFDEDDYRVVDIRPFLRGPMFEPLMDGAFFKRARVDHESGTVTWPNGADLDPQVLYENSVPLKLRSVERKNIRFRR
ncbi:MAG: DUF2442 domain-containing protein [Desulforudis sp.]|nr:MAG: DUF2442 domain-containing protein [Desulforudis sp.]